MAEDGNTASPSDYWRLARTQRRSEPSRSVTNSSPILSERTIRCRQALEQVVLRRTVLHLARGRSADLRRSPVQAAHVPPSVRGVAKGSKSALLGYRR